MTKLVVTLGTILTLCVSNDAIAQTINIVLANIDAGSLRVEGNQAPRKAAVIWEGVATGAISGSGGSFAFSTTNVPADCVGRLTIGTSSRDVVVSGCTPAPVTVVNAGVARTGMTETFDTGDDGDLQKGVPLPSPRFTDNQNGTVTDNLTKLIWLKNARCPWSPFDVGSNSPFDAVVHLNATGNLGAGTCGDTSNNGSHQTDWRLPNVREFLSLLNYAYNDPAISNRQGDGRAVEGDPFNNLIGGDPRYQTSTRQADCLPSTCNVPIGAPPYSIFLYNGKIDENAGTIIWPVRGGN
jgi:hypothetical protein